MLFIILITTVGTLITSLLVVIRFVLYLIYKNKSFEKNLSENELKTIYKCWNLIVNKEIIYLLVNSIMILTISQIVLDKNFNFDSGFEKIRFQIIKGVTFIIFKVIMRMNYKQILVKRKK